MKSRFRRCCTYLLHLMGTGGVAFHLDFLMELWLNFKRNVRKVGFGDGAKVGAISFVMKEGDYGKLGTIL